MAAGYEVAQRKVIVLGVVIRIKCIKWSYDVMVLLFASDYSNMI